MDLDDTGKAGVSLADLLSAAESGDPLDVRVDAAAMDTARAGIAALADARLRLRAAQGRPEQSKILADLLRDTDVQRALGYAHRLCPAELTAELQEIRGLKLGSDATAIAKVAKEMGDRQGKAIERRMAEAQGSAQGALLDRLTRDLGVKGLRCPPGYAIDTSGVWRDAGDGQERIASAPLLILSTAQDLHTREIRVRIAWRRRDQWCVHTVSRGTIMDSRGLIALANLGAPVSTSNTGPTVEYLAAFETANLPHMVDELTTPHMGWQDDATFVVGPDSYSTSGRRVQLVAAGGLATLGERYRAEGTWEGWCAVVEELVADRPLAMLAIYSSIATALLRVLRQPGFVVDWSGESSVGKSTALVVGASCWGNPDDKGTGIIQTWSTASAVGPMTLAHFCQSIPVYMDETKRAKDKPQIVTQSLYDIPAGQDRLKGAAGGGLQVCNTWRTALLSTGEAPITSFGKDGGARARTLCLRGSPFGEACDENRRAAEAVRDRLAEHHGHLGRKVVAWLVTNRDKHAKMRDRFEKLREKYAEGHGGVAGRAAAYVAVLKIAADLCHFLGMPKPVDCDPIALALHAALEETREQDPPTEALRALYAWAVAHSELFEGRRTNREAPPRWEGVWTSTRLGIVPESAREQLARWGYDVDGVIESWFRRGWLATNPGRRLLRTRMGEGLPYLLTLDLAKVEAAVK